MPLFLEIRSVKNQVHSNLLCEALYYTPTSYYHYEILQDMKTTILCINTICT